VVGAVQERLRLVEVALSARRSVTAAGGVVSIVAIAKL
jgi:hypothetical protein